MKAVIMSRDRPQVQITWNPDEPLKAKVALLTDKFDVKIPYYLRTEKATYKDFLKFLETRCPPRNREDIQRILRNYDLKFYNPLGMCLKSYGRSPTDFIWVDFNDSGLKWDDIKLRDD